MFILKYFEAPKNMLRVSVLAVPNAFSQSVNFNINRIKFIPIIKIELLFFFSCRPIKYAKYYLNLGITNNF